jgi:hypothetical protein
MISKNWGREKELYALWKEGYSIKRAHDVTGIPMSTIGYYFRKFNNGKKPEDHGIIDIFNLSRDPPKKEEEPTRNRIDRISDLARSIYFSTEYESLIRSGKYKEAKELCEAELEYFELKSVFDKSTKGLGLLTKAENDFVKILIDGFVGKPLQQDTIYNASYRAGYSEAGRLAIELFGPHPKEPNKVPDNETKK